jgi:hypothetical protein
LKHSSIKSRAGDDEEEEEEDDEEEEEEDEEEDEPPPTPPAPDPAEVRRTSHSSNTSGFSWIHFIGRFSCRFQKSLSPASLRKG